ncbi:MAG: transglutaminase domain-containing protein [Acidimicrobiaceae bacterium]|nr:transglutaminase domain-containing protein [Acidimicrobiaceae bacterium]
MEYYCSPSAMTALPSHPLLSDLPKGPDPLRSVVQDLVLHREWADAYGVEAGVLRVEEQNLRSAAEVLGRAFEISPDPVAVAREPADRVVGICWHFAVLYAALLRAQGAAVRVRCGFAGYFDAAKWYDHWITERWDGEQWISDDPQIDARQAERLHLDFDPHDQPPGRFLTGGEAWLAARAGEVDPERFGIYDMWGMGFLAGNVVKDFACLNKVELLPWDSWGMLRDPYRPPPKKHLAVLDEIAELAATDDLTAIRHRFDSDEQLRVPQEIVSYTDGQPTRVQLPDLSDAFSP